MDVTAYAARLATKASLTAKSNLAYDAQLHSFDATHTPNSLHLRRTALSLQMTTALLDRLTHHCHIVETGNESYRFRHSSASAKKRIRSREAARKGDTGSASERA